MTRQPKWKLQSLAVEDIREREDHQVRSQGLSAPHVNTLSRVMADGGSVEPIKVAKVGKAHYVVDGFHRLAAARKLRLPSIEANVATMSAPEAKAFAMLANTKHGKPLSREDKGRALDEHVAQGKHLDDFGAVKSSRAIAADINHIYSHETVRKKLKDRGIVAEAEVEWPHGYTAWGGGDEDEAELAQELAEGAEGHLSLFGSLYFDLDDYDQRRLLKAARDLVERLERGERPERIGGEPSEGSLDI